MNQIITISRQFGSGGRTIGKLLAKKLGVPCYDKELIEQVACESGYAKEYIAREGEYAPGRGRFTYSFMGRGEDGLSNADRIWFAQRKVILELAEKGPCIIVGRCADYVLRDYPQCLHTFVYADDAFRKKRIVTKYGETTHEPEKRLADKDKKRMLNYRYFTGRKWGETSNYHLCIDSSKVGIEGAVRLICLAAEEMSRLEISSMEMNSQEMEMNCQKMEEEIHE